MGHRNCERVDHQEHAFWTSEDDYLASVLYTLVSRAFEEKKKKHHRAEEESLDWIFNSNNTGFWLLKHR